MFYIVTPKIVEMIQFDFHIFQMGWFNHQLVIYLEDHHQKLAKTWFIGNHELPLDPKCPWKMKVFHP